MNKTSALRVLITTNNSMFKKVTRIQGNNRAFPPIKMARMFSDSSDKKLKDCQEYFGNNPEVLPFLGFSIEEVSSIPKQVSGLSRRMFFTQD